MPPAAAAAAAAAAATTYDLSLPTLQVDLHFNFRSELLNNVSVVVLSTFDSEFQLRPDGEIHFPDMYDVKMQKPA